VLADLFEELAAKSVVVDIITQSESEGKQRLAFSIPVEDIKVAQGILNRRFPAIQIEIMDQVSKISIVGVGMRHHPGVAALFFKTLSENNINVHLVTTSEIKVSAIIPKEKLSQAVQTLHTAFKLDL
jgi:aspartate kinase